MLPGGRPPAPCRGRRPRARRRGPSTRTVHRARTENRDQRGRRLMPRRRRSLCGGQRLRRDAAQDTARSQKKASGAQGLPGPRSTDRRRCSAGSMPPSAGWATRHDDRQGTATRWRAGSCRSRRTPRPRKAPDVAPQPRPPGRRQLGDDGHRRDVQRDDHHERRCRRPSRYLVCDGRRPGGPSLTRRLQANLPAEHLCRDRLRRRTTEVVAVGSGPTSSGTCWTRARDVSRGRRPVHEDLAAGAGAPARRAVLRRSHRGPRPLEAFAWPTHRPLTKQAKYEKAIKPFLVPFDAMSRGCPRRLAGPGHS